MPDSSPAWIAAVCSIPRGVKRDGLPIRDSFGAAAPDLSDDARGIALIRDYLTANPDLIPQWQTFSDDNRGIPSHYMTGCEVGFYDIRSADVTTHEDELGACADFIYRKAAWVLQRRRVRVAPGNGR